VYQRRDQVQSAKKSRIKIASLDSERKCGKRDSKTWWNDMCNTPWVFF